MTKKYVPTVHDGNLLIYGCNAGHIDHKENNIASSFAKKVEDSVVIASDGTVTGKNEEGFYKSIYDTEFERHRNINSSRINAGWIVYRYNGKYITTRDTGNDTNRLSVAGGIQISY